MDSLEYIRRVGEKIERELEAGTTKSWSELVKSAGDAVMVEEEEE